IDLGEVDGLQFEEYTPELQATLLNAPATVHFPGGESYEQLRRRVVGVLDEIVAQHGDEAVVAVSHAGAIRAALATWLSIPPQSSFRIDQRFASVNLVDWIDGVPLVRLVNGPGPERSDPDRISRASYAGLCCQSPCYGLPGRLHCFL